MWTQQQGSHRRKATQEFAYIYICLCIFVFSLFSPTPFCGACLDFLSRKGFSRPFPSSTVKSNLVYPRHNRSPLVGHDVRESPSSSDSAEIVLTSQGQKVSRLRTEPPGWPATYLRQATTTTAACGSCVLY